MKNIIFPAVAICFATILNAANMPDMSAYDQMFNDLSKNRAGLSNEQINKLKSPFPTIKQVESIATESKPNSTVGNTLNAILIDRVKVNEKWYKVGDYIGSYRIMEIKSKSIILSNEENNMELKLNQGNQNVVITYK
ncbi:hypothetical protein [Campylobacter geochelonis]|uniref:Transformation system protein n=1 Tax=Campylobacter geochelonis TaxID=1780362 RepID=A0A128EL71_9BACT|nr:hypothetical protein [Campylobacter geochelonis]QKF71244.1 hypothetical protein CGEO_0928 [Campylobacter geochelonis]CZE49182.1 transformation system protein [Campylobacter geochelonis]